MLLRSKVRLIPICIIIMMMFSACSKNSEEKSEETTSRPTEDRIQNQDIDEDKDITEREETEDSWDWSVQQP